LPAGLKIGYGTQHMRVTVDTFCSYWNVCVDDSTFGLKNQGIRSVTLLDDPGQDLVKATLAKAYFNTRLDDSLDPGKTRDINFSGDDSDECFKVLVNKPIDSAWAPLFIADDQGNAVIVDLHYTPPLVKLTPESGSYLLTGLSKDSCSRFVFYNQGKIILTYDTTITIDSITHKPDTVINHVTHHIGKSFTFSSDNLKLNNPNFTVKSPTVPPLPATIKPGDSLVITTCYSTKDTITQRDTIELVTDCFTEPIDLIGNGATGLIVADDHDFGSVIVDSTKCAPVGVKNVGNAPLVLTKQWLIKKYGVIFSFPDSTLLPMTINPGQKITLDFCYTPQVQGVDSTVMLWGTNIPDPYKHQVKDTSILTGRGVLAGFAWDRTEQSFGADSLVANDSVIIKVYLYNNATDHTGGPTVHVDNVIITGADASEFLVLSDKLGIVPLRNFDIQPGDSIWVAVMFKPDVTKPFPQKYADRHADLIASSISETNQIVNLIGTWVKNGVAVSAPPLLFTIHPNPASGNSVIVSFSSPQETPETLVTRSLRVYDILGREVFRKEILPGISETEIPLRNLENGTYYVRLISPNNVSSQKFDIAR
jgi:hypothetical protein